jgi:hypothetical protein
VIEPRLANAIARFCETIGMRISDEVQGPRQRCAEPGCLEAGGEIRAFGECPRFCMRHCPDCAPEPEPNPHGGT